MPYSPVTGARPMLKSDMLTAIVVALVVLAVLAAITASLRSSARAGMPSKDVLQRAAQRSRELDAREKAERSDHGD